MLQVIAWNVITSKKFSLYVSEVINSYLKKQNEFQVSYQGITLKVFPPSLIFKEIEITGNPKIPEISYISIKSEKLILDFNIFTHIVGSIKIANVELENGIISTNINENAFSKENDKQSKFEWNENVYKKILSILKVGPAEILRFALTNIKINANLGNLLISNFSWENLGDKFESKAIIGDGSISKDFLSSLNLKNKEIESILQNEKLNQASWLFLLDKKIFDLNQFNLNLLDFKLVVKGNILRPFDLNKSKNNLTFESSIDGTSSLLTNSNFHYLKLKNILSDKNHEGSFSRILVKGKLNKSLIESNLEGAISIFDLKSKYVDLKALTLDFQLNSTSFIFKDLFARDQNEGVVQSIQKVFEYNFQTRKRVFNFDATLNKVSLKNALKNLPEVSSVLDAQVSGKLQVQIFIPKDKFLLILKSLNPIQVTNLRLDVNKKNIILVKELYLDNTQFNILPGLELSSSVSINNRKFELSGLIDKKNLKFQTNKFFINFEDFGNIANLSLKGEGQVQINCEGPIQHPNLFFEIEELEKSSFLGFYLGVLSGKMNLNFETREFIIQNITGKFLNGNITGSGVVNLKTEDLNVKVKANQLNYSEVLNSHSPIIPKFIKDHTQKFSGSFDMDYQLTGKFKNIGDLKVKANMRSNRLLILGEQFFDVVAEFILRDNNLIIPKLKASLGRSNLIFDLGYDLLKKDLKMILKSENMKTSDFNFYNKLDASFNSLIELEGAFKRDHLNQEGYFSINLKNSKIGDRDIENSFFALKLNNDSYQIKGDYAKGKMNLISLIDFSQKNNDSHKKSFITLKSNITNWGYLLNLVSSFDLNDPVLEGNFAFELDSVFNANNLKNSDLDFLIKKMTFTHPSLDIHKTSQDSIRIINGEIQKWDLKLMGNEQDYIESKGTGNIAELVSIKNSMDINLAKLNYFWSSYLELAGEVKFDLLNIYDGKKDVWTNAGKIISQDLVISNNDYIRSLGNSTIILDFDDEKIKLSRLQMNLGTGLFNLWGDIKLKAWNPIIDLRYRFENAQFQFASRSDVVIDGAGSLTGDKSPYVLSGDLKILKGEILNEFDEITFGSQTKKQMKNVTSNIKYLPKRSIIDSKYSFQSNVNINSDRPLKIRNTMVDISPIINLNLAGNLNDPHLIGRIYTKTDQESFVNVKNNVFKLNRFNIIYDHHSTLENPSLDIDSEANINAYLVKAKIYGSVKKFQLDLSSNPPLARQSILSLIAFGYAEDVTENLSNEDRESLSSIGVGTFIFDRLKLNETLHENLGLTLNVGTEYVSEGSSMLQGRSNQSSSSVGRVRTATKLELRKKIDEKIGLSVSSTLSGNSGQKQSMNLNYNINKKVSLDGIYEVKTDQFDGENRSGISAGGDVKFRWTFK